MTKPKMKIKCTANIKNKKKDAMPIFDYEDARNNDKFNEKYENCLLIILVKI
jgi:hypothetical protein